jgi:hypothetical protein
VGKPELNVRTPFPDLSTQFVTPAPIAGSTPFPLGSAPSNQSLRPDTIGDSMELPRLFTRYTKFEVFTVVRDPTVEVSCAREIYPAVPSPAILDVTAFDVIL